MPTIEVNQDARNMRFGIVVSRFNEKITSSLLKGALKTLREHHAKEENITIAWVPGAFEIPLAAKKMAKSGKVDCVICLGAVIKGETAHFEYVAGPCADHIAAVGLETEIPLIFGVLTTYTLQQALGRIEENGRHMGTEAAECAIHMVDLLKKI